MTFVFSRVYGCRCVLNIDEPLHVFSLCKVEWIEFSSWVFAWIWINSFIFKGRHRWLDSKKSSQYLLQFFFGELQERLGYTKPTSCVWHPPSDVMLSWAAFLIWGGWHNLREHKIFIPNPLAEVAGKARTHLCNVFNSAVNCCTFNEGVELQGDFFGTFVSKFQNIFISTWPFHAGGNGANCHWNQNDEQRRNSHSNIAPGCKKCVATKWVKHRATQTTKNTN